MCEVRLALGKIVRLAKSDLRTPQRPILHPAPTPGRVCLEQGEGKRELASPPSQYLLWLPARPPVTCPIHPWYQLSHYCRYPPTPNQGYLRFE